MSSLIVDVAKINAIEKHPNADRLRIATVKGWKCIIGLDDFNEGDLVIFIPPDSVLPDEMIDTYKLDYLKKGSRIKTIKLRGFISQGLCLPIPSTPSKTNKAWVEGQDVAKELGITKYEPPSANYQGKPKETIKSTFLKYREGKISFRRFVMKSIGIIKDSFRKKKNINPLFTKYTDMENIKNFNTIFTDAEKVVITEKVHGTNFRAGYLKRPSKYFWQRWILKMLGEYEFVYGSHNVQLSFGRKRNFYGEDVYGKMAEKYKLAEIVPEDYIVYGEIYGKNIQELEYEREDIDLVIFDVKYKEKYLDYSEFLNFCISRSLPIVPVLTIETFKPELIAQYTNGLSNLARIYTPRTKHIREGCVIKPLVEQNNHRVGRKILKSISEEYLVTKDRTEHH